MPTEAGHPCEVVPDPFGGPPLIIPVECTVWYKVAGTGQSVTVGPDPYVPYGTLKVAVR